MAFCSTFNTDEARPDKVFPKFELNSVNSETFLSLDFCRLQHIWNFIISYIHKAAKFPLSDPNNRFTNVRYV